MQRDGTRYLSVLLIPGELTSNYFEATQRGIYHRSGTTPRLSEQHGACSFIRHSAMKQAPEKYPVLYLLHVQG